MKVAVIFSIFFLCLISSATKRNNETELFLKNETIQTNEVTQILEQLKKLDLRTKSFARSVVDFTFPYFMNLGKQTNLSRSCMRSGIHFLEDLMQLKEWTLRMLDAFGKPAAGILGGTFWIRGDYDQCLNIESIGNETSSDRKPEIIQGKYCVIKIKFPSLKNEVIEAIEAENNNTLIRLIKTVLKPFRLSLFMNLIKSLKLSFRFDVCVPSTCTEEDVEKIANHLLEDTEIDYCEIKGRKANYSVAQVICIISFISFFILVIVATFLDFLLKLNILDLNKNKNIGKLCRGVISVSAFKSIKELFSDTLWERTSSLCGIKTLLIYLIVFAHIFAYLIQIPTIEEKIFNFLEMFHALPMEISFNAIAMVDSFFFISGYLMLYQLKKKEIVLTFLYVVRRIISLTLPVLCTIATMIILPLLSNGPHWQQIIRNGDHIEKNWWQYVLHVKNFLAPIFQIVAPLWFINVLVQLTVLTFPFVIMKNRWPKFGAISFIFLILVGFITFASQMFSSRIYLMMGYSYDNIKFMRYITETYTKPFGSHLSSYCFGLLIGSVFSKKTELKIGNKAVISIWITVATLMSLVIFGSHGYINDEFPNETLIVLHKLLSPYAWTVGIAWISVASATNHGGLLHWFLSLKIFVVLDRLNLWIFLLHPFAIFFVYGQLRNGLVSSEINLWMPFTFVMFLSLIASFFFYIFLHYPLNNSIKEVFNLNELKKNSPKDVLILEILTVEMDSENQMI